MKVVFTMKINSKLVDIQYLIKFQSKQTYAEALREKGELFMQSVETYINMEKYQNNHGQGDIREAIYFNCVRVGIDHPTYCMYAVTRDSIINGNCSKKFWLNEKVTARLEKDRYLGIFCRSKSIFLERRIRNSRNIDKDFVYLMSRKQDTILDFSHKNQTAGLILQH